MNNFPEEASRRYVIVYSDRASADLDSLNLFHNGRDHVYADRWNGAFHQAVNDLTGFPGPFSHARDEDATGHYSREVRRLLYYGPTRKRSGTPVRILFTILPPAPDEPPETAEAVIFLLRLLRGGQTLVAEDDPA